MTTYTLNIYIIHCKRLTNREENINRLKRLAANETGSSNIKVIVVDEHQPESININNIKNLVKIDKLPEEENQYYQSFVKQMSVEILSNTFNHFKAIQQISKNNEKSYNLILEDDVMYSDKIFNQLNSLISRLETTSEWDMVFLGQPSDKVASEAGTLVLNSINNNDLVLHCCESYMVNVNTAKNMLLNFFPIRFTYNIQLSFMINKHDYKCIKIFPNICGDGSKMGNYTSSILMNNVLLFNNLYKEIYLLLENNPVLTDDIKEKIDSKFKENTKYTNPDFLYLEGLYNKRIGNFEKCKELFSKAMAKYEEDCVPMNNTSTFLRNYIELFKVIE